MTRIFTIEMLKVNYRGKNGNYRYDTFKSIEKAASKIAWWMLYDKYGYDFAPNRKFPLNAGECKCYQNESYLDNDEGTGSWWGPCPIHNRVSGYLKRIHKRLCGQIIKHYKETQC